MNGISRNDDGTHGPEHMSDDEIRAHVADIMDTNPEWTNYGDVNPELHGGRFVRYNPDEEMYQIIETRLWSDMAPDGREDRVRINRHVYDDEYVFEDGDPANGFTDVMVDILESLGMSEHSIDVTNPDILERIQYYIADLPHYVGQSYIDGESIDREEYWTHLSEWDIKREHA